MSEMGFQKKNLKVGGCIGGGGGGVNYVQFYFVICFNFFNLQSPL